jgi:hypothetical protein
MVAAFAPRSAMAERYSATVWSDAGRAASSCSVQKAMKSRQPEA